MILISYILFFITYCVMSAFIFFKSGIRKKSIRFIVSFYFLYFLMAFLRAFLFNSLLGVDCDEAMGAINSWSMGRWGIDYFNLTSAPIYLYAWGSGMNIFYPAICIPFVKLFGLNIIAYRTPLILINIIAIGFLAYALLKTFNSKNVLLALIIIFLSPATIVNSRWAVESNLFPTIFYLVFAFFILYKKSKSKNHYILMNLAIALSAYAYSNNWIFLLIFVTLILLWQWKIKWISIKQLALTVIAYIIIEIPLIAFLFVNYVSHKTITIFGLSISKMDATRSVFVNFTLKDILLNIKNVFMMFLTGFDGNPKMGIVNLGPFLPFMLTFFIIGLILLLNHKNKTDDFMIIMLISLLPNIIFIYPNWIHCNALILPILYFEYRGVEQVFKTKKSLSAFILLFFALLGIYTKEYVKGYTLNFNNGQNNTPIELESMLHRANAMYKETYLVADKDNDGTNVPAMFLLPIFYNKIDPFTFHNETKKVKAAEFRQIDDYGKWHIRDMSSIKESKMKKNTIYIIQNRARPSRFSNNIRLIKRGNYYTMLMKN